MELYDSSFRGPLWLQACALASQRAMQRKHDMAAVARDAEATVTTMQSSLAMDVFDGSSLGGIHSLVRRIMATDIITWTGMLVGSHNDRANDGMTTSAASRSYSVLIVKINNQGAYVLFTGRIPMRAFQTTLLVSMPDLLASVDVEALTLANTAIETRHHVCKTSPRSTVRVQKMPLLLEWHPELPTAMTPVDETKELFYVMPLMDHDNLGQLHRLSQSTPASPVARLPIVTITVTVRHLQFKTIASVLSHKTPSSFAFKISIRFSKALTLAHSTIETHHKVCLTPVDVRKRVLPRPALRESTTALPLLLEWHPEMPTTTISVNNVKKSYLVPPSATSPTVTDLHQPYRYTYAGADLFYNIRLKTITADLATASPGSVVWKIPALYGQAIGASKTSITDKSAGAAIGQRPASPPPLLLTFVGPTAQPPQITSPVRTAPDARTEKTVKRQLWSDELDLSAEEQARALHMYLAINPWADDVKPADYQEAPSTTPIRYRLPPPASSSTPTDGLRSEWALGTEHIVLPMAERTNEAGEDLPCGTAIQNNELSIEPPAHTSAPTQPTDDVAQARRLSVYARLGPHPVPSEPVTDDAHAERRSVHTRLGRLHQPTAPTPTEVPANRTRRTGWAPTYVPPAARAANSNISTPSVRAACEARTNTAAGGADSVRSVQKCAPAGSTVSGRLPRMDHTATAPAGGAARCMGSRRQAVEPAATPAGVHNHAAESAGGNGETRGAKPRKRVRRGGRGKAAVSAKMDRPPGL